MSIKLELPVYFNITKDKKVLVGSNFARSKAHYHTLNKVKRYYSDLVADKLKEFEPIGGQFKVRYTYFYKNPLTDGSNVVSQIDKYLLDAIQEIGLVVNDNVKYNIGASWSVGGQDKENPRVEVEIYDENI